LRDCRGSDADRRSAGRVAAGRTQIAAERAVRQAERVARQGKIRAGSQSVRALLPKRIRGGFARECTCCVEYQHIDQGL